MYSSHNSGESSFFAYALKIAIANNIHMNCCHQVGKKKSLHVGWMNHPYALNSAAHCLCSADFFFLLFEAHCCLFRSRMLALRQNACTSVYLLLCCAKQSFLFLKQSLFLGVLLNLLGVLVV